MPAATMAVWQRMREHAFSGWPFAFLFIMSAAGAVYASQAGFPATVRANTFIMSFVFLVVWEVAVLKRMVGAEHYAPIRTELRYAASLLLYAIILVFGGVFILFPVIMATMALWALVSFEFESPEPTQEELTASFEVFQSHPLFAVCVLIFALGIFGFGTLFMRGRAFAPASISEQRIVAMEGFNWTRTHGLFLFGLGFLALLPFVIVFGLSMALLPSATSATIGALALSSLLVGLAFWLIMLALQAMSTEVYQRFRP